MMFLDTLKVLTYHLIFKLVCMFPSKKGVNTLIVIKTDEIGDYVLFRGALRQLRESAKYRHFKIILIGNLVYKSLFESFDRHLVDEVVWLDKKRFLKNPTYRFRFLKAVRRIPATQLINMIYSQVFRLDGVIAAVSGASVKVAMSHETKPYSKLEFYLTPKTYNRRINGGNSTQFDALRNHEFISTVLELPNTPPEADLSFPDSGVKFQLPETYYILFPGSGIKTKKWPASSFSSIAEWLDTTYSLTPVLCGAKSDIPDYEEFDNISTITHINLMGKTTLPEFLSVLRGAKFIISVDTGAVHLAAAVKCPVFGLFSGLHYGRFAPYPDQIFTRFYAIYPDDFEEKWLSNSSRSFENVPIDLIKRIPPEKVIGVMKKHLPELNIIPD